MMMTNFLAIVVLACVILEASANPSEPEAPSADFQGLNKYLMESMPETGATEALAQLKANLDSLDEPVRKAADLVVELSAVGDKCDDHVLSMLQHIARAYLNHRAIKRVMRGAAGLEEILGKCAKYVEKLNHDLMEDAKFGSQMHQMPSLYSEVGRKSTIPSINRSLVSSALEILADSETIDITQDRQKFDQALKTYLLEPCQQFLSDPRLNIMLNGISTITSLARGDSKVFDEPRFIAHKMGWRRQNCIDLLNMNTATRKQLFPR